MRISWSGKFKVARGSLIKAEESIKNEPILLILHFDFGHRSPIVGFVVSWAKPQNSEEFSLLLDAFSCETWEIWWEMPKTEQNRPLGTIEKKKKQRFDSHWIINHFWIFNILIWSICTTRIFPTSFDLLTLFSPSWPRCCDTIKLLIWLLSNIVGSWWGHLNLLSI